MDNFNWKNIKNLTRDTVNWIINQTKILGENISSLSVKWKELLENLTTKIQLKLKEWQDYNKGLRTQEKLREQKEIRRQEKNKKQKDTNKAKDSKESIAEYQQELYDKINNKESVSEIWELRWTHRTTYEALEQILNTWIIWWNWKRWIEFQWGLWACYGDIILIMKDSVMQLPAANEIAWAKVQGQENMHYFFQREWNWQNRADYQKQHCDFSFNKPNATTEMPYLSIGGKNVNTSSSLNNQVWIEHIEAVMLPAHLKSNSNYHKIVEWLHNKWIKTIEMNTSNNILDYAWWSIVFIWENNWRSYFDTQLKIALNERYPNQPLEQQILNELKSRWIDTQWKTLEELRNNYLKQAENAQLSRWNYWKWQYQNYCSQKNHTIEQQYYFKHILDSRTK